MNKPDLAPGLSPGKLVVKKSPTADTRTCDPSKVDKATLLKSSEEHIADVDKALSWMESQLELRSYYFYCRSGGLTYHHDHDKISNIDQFHDDFQNLKGADFVDGKWYTNHLKVNRHHIDREGGCPEDDNLIDVIEHVCDVVMAGMARSGDVYPLNLSNELLQKAAQNTVEMLKASVEVVD